MISGLVNNILSLSNSYKLIIIYIDWVSLRLSCFLEEYFAHILFDCLFLFYPDNCWVFNIVTREGFVKFYTRLFCLIFISWNILTKGIFSH